MPTPGFYVWEVPGKWISIELSLDAVDRLQQSVIRAFGSLPRRGAEVGGILIGTVSGGGRVVRVTDYREVPIDYRQGPSYLLSGADTKAFEAAVVELRSQQTNLARPIGYYRSHTREGVGLGEEDLDLVSKNFPDPETIVLLIRPYGTKPATAGFYFKENGRFQSGPPLMEFVFSRRDLAPEDPAQAPDHPSVSASVPSRVRRAASLLQSAEMAPVKEADAEPVRIAPLPTPLPAEPEAIPAPFAPEAPAARSGWVWLPVSLVFLLVGLLAGFQAATGGFQPFGGADPYALSLSVAPAGNDLDVRWDRQSTIIRKALKGSLTIDDGDYHKTIDLDMERLQGSSELVYRHYSNRVRFRLEVFLKDSSSVAEAVEWKQSQQAR